ncbi:MAG: ImcF-related family protein [Terracidiphilus sp.]|nr:ImcF-related family protein [Terracidiphilus sp.]
MLVYVGVLAVLVVAALLAFGGAALLHLHGVSLIVFVVVILLLGVAAATIILILHFRAKKKQGLEGDSSGGGATANLDLLLNDANGKLRTSQQGAKTLDLLPLLYILGEQGAAKTTQILRSGLDPELLAGTVPREGEVVATPVVNVWFTRQAAIIEAGEAVRQNSQLLTRLIERTRARAYRSAFGSAAASRAAVVCVSIEQLLAADAGASSLAAARSTGAQLREISRLLGTPLPVYVIVTKLDRVPHFEEFVRNLSNDEVKQILGNTLPRVDASAGLYADRAASQLGGVLDVLCYTLGEFRVEMLARETEPRNTSGVYEFPREFGKLRKNLNEYLVELCKPSQLSVNPYLRGFYFSGIRAQVVERMSAPVAQEERPLQDAGATQYLNISLGRSPSTRPAPQAVKVSTRVPQWTFLPRLFPEVILGDKSALSATQQTAPARLFRRFLFGTLAVLFFVYTILLLVSYLNNSSLETKIRDAGRSLSVAGPASVSLPSLGDLQALDQLRQTIVQLDGYERDGAPWSYRFGLYQGDNLDLRARSIYFDRFRPMLLNPAQANLVQYLRALPDAPTASDDSSSYVAAYNPLKAYLITAGNHEKSVSQFLTPVMLQYWNGSRQVDPVQEQLAQKQIDFYSTDLARQDPYSINPDAQAVPHARSYLSHFVADNSIYLAMLNDADKTGPAVDFNRNYPGSAASVVDSYVVRGAFTKSGYAFMQDAFLHIDRYAKGEAWVLGSQAGPPLDLDQIRKNLSAKYSSDFINQWHTFLTRAQVVSCGGIHEAPEKLNALSGSNSPLLLLFYTVGHNTAVADPQVKQIFASTQSLVDPNAVDKFIGPGNQAYMGALLSLSSAVSAVAPTAGPDPAAYVPITTAAQPAEMAARQTAQAFSIDSQFHTENTVLALLLAPVQCAAKLPPSPGAAANGAGAKLCGTVNSLLGKFPFSPNATNPATLDEVNQVFAPDTGAVWTIYNGPLKPYLVPAGAQYVPAPTAPQPVNAKFAQYFSKLAHVSSDLYSPGAKTPAFNFTLRFIPSNGIKDANFLVDGQRIPSGSTTQQYKWSGADARQASLVTDIGEVPYQGTWALFQLVHKAQQITRTEGKLHLDYSLETTLAGQRVNQGKMVSFEVTGPGAELLDPNYLSGLSCVSTVVKAQ